MTVNSLQVPSDGLENQTIAQPACSSFGAAELRRENSPWWGCVESDYVTTLLRPSSGATSGTDGREVPMMISAVLTTLCSDLLSEALEMLLLSVFSVVSVDGGQDGRRPLCSLHPTESV